MKWIRAFICLFLLLFAPALCQAQGTSLLAVATSSLLDTTAQVIFVLAGLVAIMGYAAQHVSSKPRELLSLYRRCARDVFHLSKAQAADVFRDQSLQKRIVNPVHGMDSEWEPLRDALRHQGVPEDALASSADFYKELVALLELSAHWRDRGKALAQQLQAPPAQAESVVPSTAPVTPAPAVKMPSGMVTFLFTDIEGSTSYWEALGARFGPVKEQHDVILRRLAKEWGGHEVVTTGDGFFFVYETASNAIQSAIAMQTALCEDAVMQDKVAPVKEVITDGVKARVGLHTGELMPNDPGSFDGPNTNKAARIMSAGYGGQILISRETYNNARPNLPPDITCADLGEYRLKGISGDVLIYQVNSPALPLSEFPRLNALSPVRVHLPAFLTPFVGRQEDVARLREALTEDAVRLVALIGPGGIGKTRLSIRAAEEVADQFTDGAWFIDLETTTEAAKVFGRIAYRLSLASVSASSDEERVLNYIASKKLLFVLDNLEQIDDPAQPIAKILDAAPQVKCLVSSRARLPVRGARIVDVSAFAIPETGATPEELMTNESVHFFVERAGLHQQDFRLTTENAPDVAGLCRQLEGVPLAMELAAAWVPLMTPREILEDFTKRLDILRGEDTDVPERMRTVQASIDWSYSRLTPDEQRVFAQIGVFRGGWTREAAVAVCDMPNTTDILRRLFDKSLVKRQEIRQQTRYSLLNTTRMYAEQKLGALSDSAQVHQRHAIYFAELGRDELAHLRTSGEANALQKLKSEFDNLQTARQWADNAAQWELSARLALSLGTFLSRHGSQREAGEWIQAGLDTIPHLPEAQPTLHADLLREKANLDIDQFDYSKAHADADALLQLCRGASQPLGIGHAHNLLGLADKEQGRFAEARAQFGEALSCYSEARDDKGIAAVKNNLGGTEFQDPDGSKDDAERWWNEALVLFRKVGDSRGVAEALTNLGNLYDGSRFPEKRDLDKAWRYNSEALALDRKIVNALGVGRTLSNLGEVAEAQGNTERACKLYAAGQTLFARVGSPYHEYTSGLYEKATECLGHSPDEREAVLASLKEKPLDELADWALGET